MTQIIAPNRNESLVSEKGMPNLRFADVLEALASNVNALVARPMNTQNESYTFLSTDDQTVVRKTSTTVNQVYTIPSNDTTPIDIGTVFEVQNDGTVAITVAIDKDTLTFEADNTTGTRTIGPGGSGRFAKVADTNWKARGQQMT